MLYIHVYCGTPCNQDAIVNYKQGMCTLHTFPIFVSYLNLSVYTTHLLHLDSIP